jgi:fructokinase
MLDVVTMGEALIDFLADRPGVTLTQARAFTWAAGGAPANVAAAAAKLGLASGFVGKVGDDPFGEYLRDTLRSCGVNTEAMLLSSEARTALAFVALPTPDSPQFTFFRHPSADMILRADELNLGYIEQSKVFHFGSITLICDPVRTATLAAAKAAKAAGAVISFDPNYRPALWPARAARARILEAMPLVDLVKVNETEVQLLTGKKDLLEGAEALVRLGPKACLVTAGADGSYYATPRSHGHVAAFPVRTVDATGCGDAFMAAALKGVIAFGDLENLGPLDLEEILRYANAAGALTATKRGAIPALPTAAQLDIFLAQAS